MLLRKPTRSSRHDRNPVLKTGFNIVKCRLRMTEFDDNIRVVQMLFGGSFIQSVDYLMPSFCGHFINDFTHFSISYLCYSHTNNLKSVMQAQSGNRSLTSVFIENDSRFESQIRIISS